MGVLEGLLGGFTSRKYDVEAENRRQGELASARERSVFEALLNSDDPETRNLAVAGLLDSASPRRKAGGMRGWIGETLASPYLARIQALSPTITESHQEALAPEGAFPGQPGQVTPTLPEPPPMLAAAAQPTTSPVDPAAQAAGVAAPQTPSWMASGPPTPMTFTKVTERPRQTFLSPLDKYQQEQIAKNRAEVAGMDAGLAAANFSPAERKSIIQAHLASRYGGSGLPYAVIQGEAPDEQGNMVSVTGAFDKRVGAVVYPGTTTPIPGFRKSPPAQSLGTDFERVSQVLFHKRGVQLSREEAATANEVMQLQKAALTPQQALSHAERLRQYGTIDEKIELANFLIAGTAAPLRAPGAAPTTPDQGGAPPAPSTATAPGATAPSTAAPPTPTAPGQIPKPPPGMGSATTETGKPLSPQLQMALGRAQANVDLIDRAIAGLEPYKEDDSLSGTVNLARNYRQGVYGQVENAAEAIQNADLAGLVSSSSQQLSSGGSRAVAVYHDRRLHAPKIPSARQIMLSNLIGASGANTLSGLTGDPNTFDSPKLMYEKLQQIKLANQEVIKELETMRTSTQGAPPAPGQSKASAAPTPPAPAAPVVKVGDRKLIRGQWYRVTAVDPDGQHFDAEPETSASPPARPR